MFDLESALQIARRQDDHSSRSDRRRFLLATAAALTAWQSPTTAAEGSQSAGVSLRSSDDNRLFRVIVKLEAKGNVDVPGNPLVSRKSKTKLPIVSKAAFDYEERYRRPDDSKTSAARSSGQRVNNGPVTYAERYYHKANVNSRLSRSEQDLELREGVRRTVVRREMLPEVVYAVDDYFTRDELDLLRMPVSSIGLDDMLPLDPVQVGSKYQPDQQALSSVLNLTSVDASDVTAEIKSIDEETAKIEFGGTIDGSVEGVPTVLRLLGKLTFDRRLGTCTWLALAVHETRDIGLAEPGFDVAAQIKMLRKPLDRPVAIPAKLSPADVTGSIPQDRLYVDLESERIGFAALMSRDWRMMSDVPGAAMMRMIRDDRSIAQCDFRPLPSLKPGEQWTLEAFGEDVKKTLGEQLVEMLDADQRVSPVGLRVLRVTASGAVEGVPIHWVLMHFSDDSGRRMLATFTMEADNLNRFAGSDLQLASSLRFREKRGLPNTTATEPEVAADPSKAPSTRIADAISGEQGQAEVQSASDLR